MTRAVQYAEYFVPGRDVIFVYSPFRYISEAGTLLPRRSSQFSVYRRQFDSNQMFVTNKTVKITIFPRVYRKSPSATKIRQDFDR